MSQAQVGKLVSKLRYDLGRRRKLKNVEGPKGRHDKIRKTVTALFKYERIELNYNRADESRGYAERLISDAIRYGDCHKETMEMANYWLVEKQLVHKLFKVLVPRYETLPLSYTKMWKVSNPEDKGIQKCVLELRNNIYPSMDVDRTNEKNLLHNILLSEAKKDYHKEKELKLKASSMEKTASDKTQGESQSQVEPNFNSDSVESVNLEKLNLSQEDEVEKK